jgi:hypothetical protein
MTFSRIADIITRLSEHSDWAAITWEWARNSWEQKPRRMECYICGKLFWVSGPPFYLDQQVCSADCMKEYIPF